MEKKSDTDLITVHRVNVKSHKHITEGQVWKEGLNEAVVSIELLLGSMGVDIIPMQLDFMKKDTKDLRRVEEGDFIACQEEGRREPERLVLKRLERKRVLGRKSSLVKHYGEVQEDEHCKCLLGFNCKETSSIYMCIFENSETILYIIYRPKYMWYKYRSILRKGPETTSPMEANSRAELQPRTPGRCRLCCALCEQCPWRCSGETETKLVACK